MKTPALLLAFLLFIPLPAGAEVTVRDDVSVTGETVMLAARIKGLILPRGGEIVEFRVDGTPLGRNLSGGDGWAFRELIPKEEKLYRIEAAFGEETGTGFLLALKKGRGIVFVDVQGGLFKPSFSREPREGSPDSIKRISEDNYIVYLYTELPALVMRSWLEESEFPGAPLFGWREGRVFDYVAGKGFKVKAVIGSAEVVESALGYKNAKLFTFGTSDEAAKVDSWEEIEEALR